MDEVGDFIYAAESTFSLDRLTIRRKTLQRISTGFSSAKVIAETCEIKKLQWRKNHRMIIQIKNNV